ncbi:MAG TPA: DUF4129 domain-containing protein [Urbifossiella sp.]|nr:DUF4129 domain-containing protein [Urbifossiella sp.]
MIPRTIFVVGALLLGSSPAAESASPDAIRRTTEEVFRRREFQSAGSEGTNWLGRQLRAIFEWLAQLHELSPLLFWSVLLLCIAALILLIVHLAFAVRRMVSFERNPKPRPEGEEERRMLSSAYQREADVRAAAGDYTEAVRFLFLALVYRFDERGRIALHKSYTNREYLGLLGERTPARAALHVMVDALDDHWYGQRPCRREQYEGCRQAFDRLIAGV